MKCSFAISNQLMFDSIVRTVFVGKDRTLKVVQKSSEQSLQSLFAGPNRGWGDGGIH